jgi:hypothetical protein
MSRLDGYPLSVATFTGGVVTLALAIMTLPSTTFSSAYAQADQQVRIFTDYELPPGSLDVAWDTVPVIVLARVQSSAQRERVGPRKITVPFTEHHIRVLEVFKGGEFVGSSNVLTINQASADAAPSSSIAKHESGGRVFKSSEEYVFFLERLPGQAALGVAWGAGGAYKVDSMTVAVPDASRRMWHLRDEVTRQEFLDSLRAKRDKRHAK